MDVLTVRCKEVFVFAQDRGEWGLKRRSGHPFAKDERIWAAGVGLHLPTGIAAHIASVRDWS
jgi:hypothetical protein